MARWHLGIDRSAIQDGTYGDFHRGQQAVFAVDLQLRDWERAETQDAAATRVEGCLYDLVARVVAVGDEWWALDCGLLVGGGRHRPDGIEVGHALTGRAELRLSPDPGLAEADGIPPLAHTWFVERVHYRVEPDPDLGDFDLGGLYGGPEEPGWEELAFTQAWQDDDGEAEYLLECLLVTDATGTA